MSETRCRVQIWMDSQHTHNEWRHGISAFAAATACTLHITTNNSLKNTLEMLQLRPLLHVLPLTLFQWQLFEWLVSQPLSLLLLDKWQTFFISCATKELSHSQENSVNLIPSRQNKRWNMHLESSDVQLLITERGLKINEGLRTPPPDWQFP